jgi:hypothetical protein
MQPIAHEHAALVALLQTSGLSWPEVAAKLVERAAPQRCGPIWEMARWSWTLSEAR